MNHVRFIALDARRVDTERRTIPATVSTEFPVDRGGYQEVLLHGPDNVDLSRAPLPLIESHDGSSLNIGTVEGLGVAGRKLRGTIRFGTSARANEVWNDVRDGIVRNVSVGYTIDDYAQDGNTLRATRWTPHEVSLVAVPADPSAGLNRNHSFPFRSIPMDNNESQPAAQAGDQLSRSQRRALNASDPATIAVEAERARVADIKGGAEALKNHEGMQALGDKAVAEGWTPDKFRQGALQLMCNKPSEIWEVGPDGGPGVFVGYRSELSHAGPMGSEASEHMARQRRYSVVRALASMIDPHRVDAGYEREVSQEIAHRSGRKPRGMYFPMGALATRDLSVSDAPALVGTQHLAGNFIDALRARSVVMQLNPTMLTGLTADVSVPRLATTSTAFWIAGDGADGLTPSTPAFDGVTLSPKTVGALVLLSRKMVLQGEPAAEDIVRNDLAQVIGSALDKAAIQGTGTSNQPTGIVNVSGISTGTFAATTPTFAEIVAMESALLGSNVDTASAVYLTPPALGGTLKTTQKASTGDEMIWTAGSQPGIGVVNGLRALASSNVPAGKIILANLVDLLIGMWGGIDLEVNPYEDFAKGTVSVRAFVSVDINVRHAASFAAYSTP